MREGVQLGSYEILARIGAGGMGEVYRAHDTKLHRDVALKVLPEKFARNEDRRARFAREAQVLAALNHPHIAHVYGVEESNGIRAFVMELVDGPTLAERIADRPLPLGQALAIARQIAEALEAAHERGVIHRDLKPANIKLTPAGAVKVLDFGLAKALDAVGQGFSFPGSPEALDTPTITNPELGVVLGTAAYMSPEQAQGKTIDKRADIWAFGCVLYEMLTGRRAFGGHTLSDTLASVLRDEPDWTRLPAETPAPIHGLLRRLLERDLRRRLHDIGDARIEIEDASQVPPGGAPVAGAAGTPRPRVWRQVLLVVAGVALTAAAHTLRAPWHAGQPPALSRRVSVELGADASPETDTGPALALSPDGSLLAFVARKSITDAPELYVRRLDQLRASLLPGTEGARHPSFSPDGKWVAFFAEGKLKKIPVTGGAAATLCEVPNGRGASWAEDGTIVFASGGLFKVSSEGGTPTSLTALDRASGERSHRWPQVLPTASAVLFTTVRVLDDFVVVRSLTTGETKVLQRGHYARYLPSGHLIYVYKGTVFAAPFDVARLQLTGPPVPVLEDVAAHDSSPVALSGAAQYTFSSDGTFAYMPGGSSESRRASISWMDRDGHFQPLRSLPGKYRNPTFSPDGRRLAVEIYDTLEQDVWVYDLQHDTMSPATPDAGSQSLATWSPDGGSIAYASRPTDADPLNIYWRRPDGTGDVQRLTVSEHHQAPASWHPSGRMLAFVEEHGETSWDIMILPMEKAETSGWKPGQPFPFLNTRFAEGHAAFSPDGRWLAYTSLESGRGEVYIRAFPGAGRKLQISSGGGMFPTWSLSRNELFYQTQDHRMMVSTYAISGDSFHAGKPRLFAQDPLTHLTVFGHPSRSFNLHPDGKRIALLKALEPQPEAKPAHAILVFNFFDELRRRAPASR
jgi:Tol biopolymer transport system component/tRNA A-37 threonylcarbamoyl transferase component Bud32